ncbi:MAG: hypothetical protein STHCBS139747_005759 [Sporothrix thermara]
MELSFVDYKGPDVPLDPDVRTLIRRQAMRNVGLDRRARGGYGQANLRQVPVFVDELALEVDRHTVESRAVVVVNDQSETRYKPKAKGKDKTKAKTKAKNKRLRGETTALPPPDSSAYTLALSATPSTSLYTISSSAADPSIVSRLPGSISYPDSVATEQFALLRNLVPLTGLRLGIGKLSSFSSDLLQPRREGQPVSLSRQLFSYDLGNPALAHFIVSHYANVNVPALQKDASLLLLYNKALRAVQAALEDNDQRLTEETLCATELLAVFELLNDNIPSWRHHAGGAAQLIRVRGTQRFRTSASGTALFLAHIGTSVMDAFLSNKACFLEEAGWTELLQSAIRNGNDRSVMHLLKGHEDLSLSIWSHLVTGPGKFKAVTDMISAAAPPDKAAREAMIQDLLADRASLVGWMERACRVPGMHDEDEFAVDEYGILFPRLPAGHGQYRKGGSGSGDGGDGGDIALGRTTRLSLWGTNIMCRILKTRLVVAMAPSRFQVFEEECQHLAARIRALDDAASGDSNFDDDADVGDGSGMGGLLKMAFISQNSWIVDGVLDTKAAWADVPDDKGELDNDRMIDRWKFDAWCKAIGRKMPRASW